jgi:hypothetical protein
MLPTFAGSRKPEQPAGDTIEAVWVTCFRSEFSALATVLQYSRIRLRRAETLEDADFMMTASGATVLLADPLFLDGGWPEALAMARESHPVAACLVVVEPDGWPRLAEVYTLGGCGILPKPVDPIEAIGVIRTADQAARDRRFFRRHCALLPVNR